MTGVQTCALPIYGRLIINAQTGETELPGVFAGGDIANDAGTVIAAMGDGKRAARAIHDYLQKAAKTGTAD